MIPVLKALLIQQQQKKESTTKASVVKNMLQNNIKDDKGVVHRFMSSYEPPEAYSVSVLSLTNGS